jgi:hypothetical protein
VFDFQLLNYQITHLPNLAEPSAPPTPIVQTRRKEALLGFLLASPLHEKKETPGLTGARLYWQ